MGIPFFIMKDYKEIFVSGLRPTYIKLLTLEDINLFKFQFKTNDDNIAIQQAYFYYKHNFITNNKCPECNKDLSLDKIKRQYTRKV